MLFILYILAGVFIIYLFHKRNKQLKAVINKYRDMAHYDELTGLFNRRGILTELDMALARAERHKECLIIIMMDLNKFKIVNDTLGHDFGDKLLIDISKRFKETFREQDIIGRLGGDEFMVICGGKNCCEEAEMLSKKILDLFKIPFKGFEKFEVSTSIGVSIYSRDGFDKFVLMKKADIAMYIAKETKTGYHLFVTPERRKVENN